MECSECKYYKERNCRNQCMDLPKGMTCSDCMYFYHCSVFYGRKEDSKKCDFEPIRFRLKEVMKND